MGVKLGILARDIAVSPSWHHLRVTYSGPATGGLCCRRRCLSAIVNGDIKKSSSSTPAC